MPNEIEKTEQPDHDDVLAAITSFNDPTIITNLFRELGWSYSVEIKETLTLAKQNANLSIKFKAIKHLRELLREAAETAGYVANVSTTAPNPQGGYTTFHAKRIAGALNPVKKIESTEIKEIQNDQKETRTEPDRGSDRGQSTAEREIIGNQPSESGSGCKGSRDTESQQRGKSGIPSEFSQDTGRAFPLGDVKSGGTESQDGDETPGRPGGGNPDDDSNTSDSESPDNPCISTRPPTCDQDLFRGISSAENI